VYVVISSLCLISLADKSSVILYDYIASVFSTSFISQGNQTTEIQITLSPVPTSSFT
jgi:hypothetical protein